MRSKDAPPTPPAAADDSPAATAQPAQNHAPVAAAELQAAPSPESVAGSVQREVRRALEELLELERANIRGELGADARQRRRELIQRFLCIPGSMVDKRRHLRVRAEHRAELRGAVHDPDARLLSLSGGGLYVATGQPPPVGTQLDVVVHFREPQETALRFQAAVRWSVPAGETRGGFPTGAGLEFLGVTERQCEAILAVMREELQRQLELAVEKYHFFFEHAPDAAVLVRDDGSILECNRQWLQASGEDEERALGAVLYASVAEAERDALRQAVQRVAASARVARCEFALLRRQGPPLRVEALLAPVRSTELGLGILLVARDLSERVALHEERLALQRSLLLTDKLASLGQVAASVAHDINNPLTCVISNLLLLQEHAAALTASPGSSAGSASTQPPESPLAESLRGALEDCLAGARRIRDIARDLKTFSRVDARDAVAVELNDAVTTSLRIVGNLVGQFAQLQVELGEVPPIASDFGKICQVLMNLLSNTEHAFASNDLARNRVRVRTWRDGQEVCVRVEDNGQGIPAALQARVFEPFFTRSRGREGLGLGLASVRDCVAVLGGTLRFDSEEGRGTRVEVRLPLRQPAATAPAPPAPAPAPPAAGRLLVLDDEEPVLRLFTRQLRQRWSVQTASTVEQALAVLEAGAIDLIVSDVMLQGRSGLELLDEVRQRFPALARRVLFMTGGAFTAREKQLLLQTDAPVIEKPFTMDELEQQLLRLLAEPGPAAAPDGT